MIEDQPARRTHVLALKRSQRAPGWWRVAAGDRWIQAEGHGTPYADYAAHAGRFIPGICRPPQTAPPADPVKLMTDRHTH